MLPVGEVKLDRSFVSGVTTDPTAHRIVTTSVALRHDLGKTVVEEGVEDAATAKLLRLSGVDLLQGYHLGRRLPAAQWPASPLPGGRLRGSGTGSRRPAPDGARRPPGDWRRADRSDCRSDPASRRL